MPENNKLSVKKKSKRKKTQESKPEPEIQPVVQVNLPVSESKPESKEVPKVKIDSWVSIANLFLTIVLGIYLAFRNENLQKQLVGLQNQIQYAKIDIQNVCENPSNCVVKITNLGPSAATNLRVVFVLESVNETWRNDIGDMVDVGLVFDNPSLSYEIRDKNVTTVGNTDSNYLNAKLVTIKSLPPETTITITPTLLNHPYVVETTITLFINPQPGFQPQGTPSSLLPPIPTLPVNMVTTPTPASWTTIQKLVATQTAVAAATQMAQSPSGLSTQKLYEETTKFINDQHYVATLTTSASCDNCSGESSTLNYRLTLLREITLIKMPIELVISDEWIFKIKFLSKDTNTPPIYLQTDFDPQSVIPIDIQPLNP